MLALYRAGRQSEALEAYREARETLIEQVGVEPGPELQRLQAAVLDQDPSLDAPPPVAELPRPARGRLAAARRARARAPLARSPLGGGARRAGGLRHGLGAARDREDAARGRARKQRSNGRGRRSSTRGEARSPEAALATVAEAGKGERPTLLVLDYADDAPAAVLEAAAGLARAPKGRPLLVCVLHHDEQGPPAFAALLESGTAQRLRLDPLGEDAMAEIAALYAPGEGQAMPVRTLIAESEGVPLRIHRAAGGWARAEAAERLAANAGRAAGDRGDLRAAQAAIAGGVVELQAAGERTRLYAAAGAARPDRARDLPVPRPGALRCRARRVLLRPRALGRRARRPPRRLDPARGRRALGERQVLGGARRPDGGARRRGRARLRALAPGRYAAGRAPARRALAHPGARGARGGARGARAVGRRRARAATGRRAPRALRGSVRGGLRRLPRRGRARGVFRRAGRRARPTPTNAWSSCSRSGPTSTGAAPSTRSSRRSSAPTRSWSGRCAATSCAGRSSCPPAAPGCGSSLDSSRRWSATSPASPAACRCSRPRCSSSGSAGRGGPFATAPTSVAGGVEGAVARLAEEAYQRLSEAERRRARPMLLRLAGDDEEAEAFVRRRVALDELELERDPDAARALAVLTESRLLTVDEGAVEVAHEALLSEWPRLRAWLEEDAEGRRLHHHLIDAAREWRDSRARSRRALPRRPARRGARLGRRARPRAERARARVPRGEPRGERARGGAAAPGQSPAQVTARRRRRPARRRRGRRGDRDLRASERSRGGQSRGRPAAGSPSAQRGQQRSRPATRRRRRRARRLRRNPRQPAGRAPAQPASDARHFRRHRGCGHLRGIRGGGQPRRTPAGGRRCRRHGGDLRRIQPPAARRVPARRRARRRARADAHLLPRRQNARRRRPRAPGRASRSPRGPDRSPHPRAHGAHRLAPGSRSARLHLRQRRVSAHGPRPGRDSVPRPRTRACCEG